MPVAKTNIKKLEIEQKIRLPKLDMLSYVGVSKKNIPATPSWWLMTLTQKQIDAHDADMNQRLSQMQVSFEEKIDRWKMRADKFQRHMKELFMSLRLWKSKYEQEYAVIKEYKRLFLEFDATGSF